MTQDEAFAKLNVEVDIMPLNAPNLPKQSLKPTYITIHNTDNASPGANARMHAQYIKGAEAAKRKVSWHFTVDDQRCVKHLPTNVKSWHAKDGNKSSIGIEICMHKGI